MSSLKQQQVLPSELAEADVAAYLQGHPEFFERNHALLSHLRLPHRTGGPAVSLVERQVSVLRQRNLQLERKLKELLDVARSNDALAGRIHKLTTQLLETRTRADLVTVLERELRVSFNADQAVLVLFRAADEPAGEDLGRFLRTVTRDDPAMSPFKTFLQSNTPRCGQVRDAQRDFLFGPGTVEIGSTALLPLGPRCELGFLAIGSRNAEHFHPGKGIDFLARLGELVSCTLRHCS